MSEVEGFSLALIKLGFVRKGAFNLAEHDFRLDNYLPIGGCYIMLTMDSIKVLNCEVAELWEAEDTDCFDVELLENTINTLNKLQHV